MGRRKQIGPRVDEDVYARFKEYTRESKGRIRGELGRMLENAMVEYMDNDRAARIERKVDTILDRTSPDGDSHAHTPNPTTERVRTIADDLRREDATVLHADTVRRIVEDVAGADDRTVRKYQRLLKERGLVWQHPTGDVWTTEKGQWFEWAEGTIDTDPTVSVLDVIDGYPIDSDEYDRMATTLEAVQ